MLILPGDNAHVCAPLAPHSGTSGSPIVVLSQEKYGRLRQFEFSHNSQSATHSSSSGMSAYNASL